jgi:hypothetical protein
LAPQYRATGFARVGPAAVSTVINSAMMEEYAAITAQVREKLFPDAQPSGALSWLAAKSLYVEPARLSGKLSRDPMTTCLLRRRWRQGPSFSPLRIPTCLYWRSPSVSLS